MTQQKHSRRNFLRTVTTAVGGTATLAVASRVVQASPVVGEHPQQEKTEVTSKGYQRTEHVETYYLLADF